MKRHDADTKGFAGILLRRAVLHHVVRKAKLGANFLEIVSFHLILTVGRRYYLPPPAIRRCCEVQPNQAPK
jgi:hypothetical protein